MQTDSGEVLVGEVTIKFRADDLPHFEEMVRQQFLGDSEMLEDALMGCETSEPMMQIADRLRFVASLTNGVQAVPRYDLPGPSHRMGKLVPKDLLAHLFPKLL